MPGFGERGFIREALLQAAGRLVAGVVRADLVARGDRLAGRHERGPGETVADGSGPCC